MVGDFYSSQTVVVEGLVAQLVQLLGVVNWAFAMWGNSAEHVLGIVIVIYTIEFRT